MRLRKTLLGVVLSLTVCGAAMAHVFWVQPTRFRVAVGDIVKIELRVGDVFPGELTPRNDEKIEKFVVVGPQGELPALGRDADTVAAVYRPKEAGTYLIGYRSKSSSVTLAADKFEEYLREKGLEKIITKRAAAGQSSAAGREMYSRSAKSVYACGDTATENVATKELGFRVEIVPKSNPASMRAGEKLELLVRSEGKPLAGALVQARSVAGSLAKQPESRLTGKTDEHGLVSFTFSKAGEWVIDTVEMFEAPQSQADADWESVWASLSFEVAGASGDASSSVSTPHSVIPSAAKGGK